MADTAFHGVFPYLVSPIDASGSVKTDVLTRLCDDLIQSGVHGLTPLGSTGEFAYLSWPQRRSIVETVVAAAKGRVPVVAGVASTTIADAVMQAREFEGLGSSSRATRSARRSRRNRRFRLKALRKSGAR